MVAFRFSRFNRQAQVVLVLLAAGFAGPCFSANYEQKMNVVYHEAHGVGLVMDIFKPTQNANGLAIIQVVSGAWYSDRGKLDDLKRALTFDILCQRGYTVFAIRPGSKTKFTAREMVAHIEHGIRWAKERAADYRFDAHRVGIMGASAGGHLASMVAVKNGQIPGHDTASVQAVCAFFPPTDLLDYNGQQLDPRDEGSIGNSIRRIGFEDGIVPKSDEEITKALTAISPARLVTDNTAPFLLIHGDADKVVPLQQSQTMQKALSAKGVDVDLIVKKGGGHPWLTIPVEIAKMADWFDLKLKNEAEATERDN